MAAREREGRVRYKPKFDPNARLEIMPGVVRRADGFVEIDDETFGIRVGVYGEGLVAYLSGVRSKGGVAKLEIISDPNEGPRYTGKVLVDMNTWEGLSTNRQTNGFKPSEGELYYSDNGAYTRKGEAYFAAQSIHPGLVAYQTMKSETDAKDNERDQFRDDLEQRIEVLQKERKMYVLRDLMEAFKKYTGREWKAETELRWRWQRRELKSEEYEKLRKLTGPSMEESREVWAFYKDWDETVRRSMQRMFIQGPIDTADEYAVFMRFHEKKKEK